MIFINRADKSFQICIVACCIRVEVLLKFRYNISESKQAPRRGQVFCFLFFFSGFYTSLIETRELIMANRPAGQGSKRWGIDWGKKWMILNSTASASEQDRCQVRLNNSHFWSSVDAVFQYLYSHLRMNRRATVYCILPWWYSIAVESSRGVLPASAPTDSLYQQPWG